MQHRRSAMLHADLSALAQLLDDRLAYTHSTGVRDDKPALLDKLQRKELVYLALDLHAEDVMVYDRTAVVVGRMTASVVVDGHERSLRTRTLEVHLYTGAEWLLTAFQSTAAPT